jgi:hypothetical protein
VRLVGAGYVVGARLEAPALLDFGAHAVGTLRRETVRVENTGDRTVDVRRSSIEGPGADQFLLGRDACAGARLQPGDRCNVRLAFAPDDGSGGGAARLVIDTEPRVTTTVELTGATAVPLAALESGPVGGAVLGQVVRGGRRDRPMVQASAKVLPPSTCGVVGVRSARARGRTIRVRVGANCPARFSIVVSRRGRTKRYSKRLSSRGTKTFRLTARFGSGGYRVAIASVVKGQLILVGRDVTVG